MEDNKCVAITRKGTKCTKRKTEGDRCSKHHEVLLWNGPTSMDREEHIWKFTYLKKEVKLKYKKLLEECTDLEERARLQKEYRDNLNDVETQKDQDLIRIEQRRLERGPQLDDEAQQRRDQHRAQQMGEWNNRNVILAQPIQAVVQNNNALINLALDHQSVHRESVVVNIVNKAVQKLLNIDVPDEYKWKTTGVSKTIVEIMDKCQLSVAAARDLCIKYLSDDNIYNLGPGIYGRTLDGVWQYIINKSDNEDMIKVLKQELEDNIGMCAQGQLTRLCNVLAGYIEDIGVSESLNEILGREFSKIMEIKDQSERLLKGIQILMKYNVSETDSALSWLEPLMEEA